MSHVPPLPVARAAAQGLAFRAKHGRGGTAVGVARARDLSNRRGVSDRTLQRMRSYFARHAVDARAAGWGDATAPSAGWIAWLLWGGDAGRKWAEAHAARANPSWEDAHNISPDGEYPTISAVEMQGLLIAQRRGDAAQRKARKAVGAAPTAPVEWREYATKRPGEWAVVGTPWADPEFGTKPKTKARKPKPWEAQRVKRNPRAEAAWATIEYNRPGEAFLLVKSTTGRVLGGDVIRIHRGSKRELYEEASRRAEWCARDAHLSLERMSQVDT